MAINNDLGAFTEEDVYRVGGLTITRRALELCAFVPAARLADIGCGKGDTVRFLRAAGFDAHGLDSNAEVTSQAGPYCRTGDARFLPYKADSMEGLFFECSLSQMAEPYQVLNEAFRVLRPGGKLVISDLYARNEELRISSPVQNRTQWLELCAKANLPCLLFEDRSDDLKAFSAQLIWQYGIKIPEEVYGCDISALKAARCGYFLMVSAKIQSALISE